MPLIGGPLDTLCYKNARAVKIGLRINAERHRPHKFHINTHSGFKSPQLLEFFALLQGRRPKLHKAFKR